MTPEIVLKETEQAPAEEKPVQNGNAESKPREQDPLRPEVRKAFEESWKRDEAAYRYLGR